MTKSFKTFRYYQARHYPMLVEAGLRREQDLAILYGTAGGKTALSAAVAAKLLAEGAFDLCIITAPTKAILDQFEKYSGKTIDTGSELVTIPELVKIQGGQRDFRHFLSLGNFEKIPLVTHHIFRACRDELEPLIGSSRIRLLILSDEAHRAYTPKKGAKKTHELSDMLSALNACGARQIKCTGTAYRASADEPVVDTENDFVVKYSLPQLMLDGYCPGNLESERILVEGTAVSDNQDLDVPQIALGAKALVKAWLRDGMPPCIIRIKPGSEEWNRSCEVEIRAAFSEARVQVRIVSAIGKDSRELQEALSDESRILGSGFGKYEDVQSVIIAIHRATEGIDSPPRTHGYCFGFPRSMNVLEQFIGRFMRSRFTEPDENGERRPILEGLDPRWIDCSKISFLVAGDQNSVDFEHAKALLKVSLFMDSFGDVALLRRLLDFDDGFGYRRQAGLSNEHFSLEEIAEAKLVIQNAEAVCGSDIFREGGHKLGLWLKLVLVFARKFAEKFDFEVKPDVIRWVIASESAGGDEEQSAALKEKVRGALDDGRVSRDAIMEAVEAYCQEFQDTTLVPSSTHLHRLSGEALQKYGGLVRDHYYKHDQTAPKSHEEVLARVQKYMDSNGGKYPSLDASDPEFPTWTFRNYDARLKQGRGLPRVESGLPGVLEQRTGSPWFVVAKRAYDDYRERRDSIAVAVRAQVVGPPEAAIETLYGHLPVAVYYPRAVLSFARYPDIVTELSPEEASVLGRLPANREPKIRELVKEHGVGELRRRIAAREV